jgi:drug/metabolite transporter (DMT)-like permease
MMNSNIARKIPRRGYIYVVLAAILWAISGSSAKFLFNNGITPFQLVQLRLNISAVSLFFFLFACNPKMLKISPHDVVYFIVLGIVGMAGVQFTYLFAISRIHVAAAILLQYLAPILIALHAVMFSHDRLNRITCFALIGATTGCYLVVGAYNLEILSMNLAGIVSGLLSAVTFAWYSIHGEYGMRRYNPWTVLFYALFVAAIVWNILHPPLEAFIHTYTFVEWGWILYIGIFGTLLPFGFYLEGINLIRSTRASITATLEPITAGIFSYIFLNEIMEALQILGAMLVIISVIILQLKQEYDEKTPQVIRLQSRTEKKEHQPQPHRDRPVH